MVTSFEVSQYNSGDPSWWCQMHKRGELVHYSVGDVKGVAITPSSWVIQKVSGWSRRFSSRFLALYFESSLIDWSVTSEGELKRKLTEIKLPLSWIERLDLINGQAPLAPEFAFKVYTAPGHLSEIVKNTTYNIFLITYNNLSSIK
uniref:Uncharacterized protein n=1 Tax=Timema tahoe TaxID=61484 RepID=A0A7R9IPP8_9NEOP|nr:unnamed protein product [Timema tahoe]